MVDFGLRLRRLRQSRNMTQQQLADRLRLTKSVISAYETDLRMPSYDILIKLSTIFGVTTDYLLGVSRGRMLDVSDMEDSDFELVMQLIARLKK